MKFAKQIENAAHDLPESWRPHLIHYKMLKKVIPLVVGELEARGLMEQSIPFEYQLDGNPDDPQPCVEVTPDDAARLNIPNTTCNEQENLIKIPLVKDSEFFLLLLQGMAQAAMLYASEQKRFADTVSRLESQLAAVASPHKQKEMYVWRQILKLYMDAAVFETGTQVDYSTQAFERSKKQLAWFNEELARTQLTRKFGCKKSREVLKHFVQLNNELVNFKWFHALNHTAMIKILKKHDKRSGLKAKTEFPAFAKTNAMLVENVVLALYSGITSQLVSVVPQVDNHSCPICYAVAWRPIRLECNHVFCVRCLIKAHRKKLYDCPLCRHTGAVVNADATNLDKGLQNFLLLYFPREIKEKRRDNEREQALMDMEALTGRAWTTAYGNHQYQKDMCFIM
ncbi:hypothetical protein O0I10_003340 [Lichtheimia ornata]|uniref:SPX domain-containing protein n=1 Tax=Lichtheimia ornata TaxID=688661 RepID=A0AAD7Y2K6_9FUNG|nr:uncharacterized protein O0I10_003340 [Lichtheimia ornata]KAJ8661117.1 hypothetical protein O0I10_003340 [Lichtheimia ornata]